MNSLQQKELIREAILCLEERMAELPDVIHGDSDLCPLKHSFGGGIYMREIHIPAGMVIVGKLHRHDHPNVLVQGEVIVVTEHGGREHLKAPVAMISRARTKRALVTLTDTYWITFHSVGEERDLAKIENSIIAKSYRQLETELVHQLEGVSE